MAKGRPITDVIKNTLATEQAKQSNPKWNNWFINWFKFLCKGLYSLYDWHGLPDGMDARFLEMCLMQDGIAGMYENSTIGYVNTRATWGELGHYEVPVRSHFYSVSGIIDDEVDVSKTSENAVLVLNDSEATSYVSLAGDYAARLADFTISHDINMDAQKTPVMLDGDYDQLEQAMKAYMQYIGGSPVIPTRTTKKQSLSEDIRKPINAIKTDAPFVADKIHDEVLNILHEFYGMVGINYANNQKRNRMLVDEVNANNQEIMLSGLAGLKTRKEAADQFNKIHGTNIEVHISINPFCLDDPENLKYFYSSTLSQLNDMGNLESEENNEGIMENEK